MGMQMGMPMPMMGMQMRMPMGGPMGGPPMGGPGGPPMGGQRPPVQNTNPIPRKREIPNGPAVTVFVGNITERAPDAMVRHLLTTCGSVLSWKRVQGATGKLQAFGFCEFSNPDAGLRSIRILNGFGIADKSLVVKVDAKTKKVLDEYITERIKKDGGDVPSDLEQYIDDDMKYEDNLAKERVTQIIKDHQKEIDSYVPKEGTSLPVQREAPPVASILQRMGTRDEGLDGVEDEKKGVITREIDRFRETMKIREAEREEQGIKKEREREKDKDRERKPSPERKSRERSPRRERSRGRDSKPRESRSDSTRVSRRRSPSPPPRERPPRVSRSRSRDRSSRARDRSADRQKSEKELKRDREMEAEEKERKKAEKRFTEKEENYQNRLLAWERRESKKTKDYEKEKSKEKKKQEDLEKEGRKLKEFLEDYDDEKDDSKFYRGRELARRMADREREAAKDAEDRRKEMDEVEELKKQCFSNPAFKDPNAEFQRQLRERERQFLPPGERADSRDRERTASPSRRDSPSPDRGPSPMDDYSHDNCGDISPSQIPSPPPAAPEPTINPVKLDSSSKRRIKVADIFNQDQDDDDDHKPKKKLKTALPPITTDKKVAAAGDKAVTAADDKKKHIKSLIEKIPTEKSALFEYVVDWDLVDNQLMEKRIRPWVNKKIAEYIGEPEPTLTDFICSKVLAGSAPKAILDDVQMVLDEEAEVFVVKMWRLLIYEIENKKQKAVAV